MQVLDLGERFVHVLHAVNVSVVCCARRLDRLQQLQKELGTSREGICCKVRCRN